MVYSYYDLMHKKTIRGYCCQDIVNGIVNTNWNDGPYIHSYYYMSNVECELRIYSLSCDKRIPDSDTSFNNSGNCTNYLRTTFSFSGLLYILFLNIWQLSNNNKH